MNGPAWFMSALAFCLACYPGLRWLNQKTKIPCGVMAISFWFIVQVFTMILHVVNIAPSHNYWVYFPLFHLASFGLGIAAAHRHSHIRVENNRISAPLALTYALFIGAALASLKWLPGPVVMAANITLFAPLFVGLIGCLNRLPVVWLNTLNRKWVVILGSLAFPIYLLQLPLMNIFRRSFESESLKLTPFLFGIYLISLLLFSAGWLVVEKFLIQPFLGLFLSRSNLGDSRLSS
jgi:peptidoglycan/LPS O-acetylase OafA/YrhL